MFFVIIYGRRRGGSRKRRGREAGAKGATGAIVRARRVCIVIDVSFVVCCYTRARLIAASGAGPKGSAHADEADDGDADVLTTFDASDVELELVKAEHHGVEFG